MQFKTIFKKITALSITTLFFGVIPNIAAINPELEKSLLQDSLPRVLDILRPNPHFATEYRDEQLTELKRLMGEYVDVPEETVNSINPLCLAIALETINEVFHKYPNIMQAFMDSIKQRGGKCFSIVAAYEPSGKGEPFMTASYQFADNPILKINRGVFGNEIYVGSIIANLKSDIADGLHPAVDENIKSILKLAVAHEIGHLIQYLVIYKESVNNLPSDHFSIVSMYKKYRELAKIAESDDEEQSNSAIEEIQRDFPDEVARKLMFNTLCADKRYRAYGAIKPTEIRHVIARGGIPDSVSGYSNTNDEEWFAELFCAAMCHHNLKLGPVFKVEPIELLKYRMLEWLDIIEKMCAK